MWSTIVFFTFIVSAINFGQISGKHHGLKPGEHKCRSSWNSTQVRFAGNHSSNISISLNTKGIPTDLATIKLNTNQVKDKNSTSQDKGSYDFKGYPCADLGVLYGCLTCEDFLIGKDCYKRLGPENLDSERFKKVVCTAWYSRTAYGEGGGVTMCGVTGGDVFQCSGDQHLADCKECTQVAFLTDA
ncbi:hypothetical protein BY996DRAFT_1331070 [Phakopsora pachyrhizi]|nr:hypothetical protein BY996DRAFT_1331070 [Phakopsora pachyrhizi]